MKQVILGIFETEELFLSTLKKIIEEKIEVNEVFTPYPIHEVFKILKRKTNIAYFTFFFVVLGLIISYSYAYWTSVKSYPLVFGGKPLHSIPSFILVGFISMISLGVLLSFITFLFKTRLYPGKKSIIYDERITDDVFVILIDKKAKMPDKELNKISTLLRENGALEVIQKESI